MNFASELLEDKRNRAAQRLSIAVFLCGVSFMCGVLVTLHFVTWSQ